MIIGFFGNLLNFGHECFTCHILVNPPCSPYTCAPSLLLDILSSPMCWILLMVRVGKPYPPSWLQNFSLTSPLRPYVGPQCFQVSILGCPSVPFQHPVRAERSYLLPSLPTIVLSLPMFSNGKTAFFFFCLERFWVLLSSWKFQKTGHSFYLPCHTVGETEAQRAEGAYQSSGENEVQSQGSNSPEWEGHCWPQAPNTIETTLKQRSHLIPPSGPQVSFLFPGGVAPTHRDLNLNPGSVP